LSSLNVIALRLPLKLASGFIFCSSFSSPGPGTLSSCGMMKIFTSSRSGGESRLKIRNYTFELAKRKNNTARRSDKAAVGGRKAEKKRRRRKNLLEREHIIKTSIDLIFFLLALLRSAMDGAV